MIYGDSVVCRGQTRGSGRSARDRAIKFVVRTRHPRVCIEVSERLYRRGAGADGSFGSSVSRALLSAIFFRYKFDFFEKGDMHF